MENYKKLFKRNEFNIALRNKKLCLFLGAGVGQNAKMPTWIQLAQSLTAFCLNNKIISHSHHQVLNKISNEAEKVISFCIKRIEEKNKQDLFCTSILEKYFIKIPEENYQDSIYKDLVKIYESSKVLIVQTNYDNLIESNTKKSSCQPYIPYLDGEKLINNNQIVYLHGKYDKEKKNYKNLVLTREQYNSVYVIESNNSGIYKNQYLFLEKLLKGYTIIFLGYSLQDREIVQIIANRNNVSINNKIFVILNKCKYSEIDCEINSKYIEEATNGQVSCYYYSTEKLGYNAFKNVIKNFRKHITKYKEQKTLNIYAGGQGVDFEH